MEIKQTPNHQPRKRYAKRGTIGQKMVSMRIDAEHLDWLEQQPNKGRYINELIAADRRQKEGT